MAEDKGHNTAKADDSEVQKRLRISEGVDVVAGVPMVIFGTFIALVIPMVQSGVSIVLGWALLPALGLVITSAVSLRNYLRLRNLPKPKAVSKRRIRNLGVFSFVTALLSAAYVAILALQGTEETQATMLILSIFGAGTAMGVNSLITSVAYAVPLLFVAWVVCLIVELGRPIGISILLGAVAFTVVRFALANRRAKLETIGLQLKSESALREKFDAEEQLRLSEMAVAQAEKERHAETAEMQRKIINAIAFPMVLSCGNHLLEVTPAARADFAIRDEDLQTTTLSDFFVSKDDQGRLIAAVSKDGQIDNFEVLMKSLTGEEFWCAVSVRPLIYNGQNCFLNSIYIIDARKRMEQDLARAKEDAEAAVVELKKAQQSLVHAEKMASLGELTAGIAHEIKNPLNFVNNFSKLSSGMVDELSELLSEPIQSLDADDKDDAEDLMQTIKSNLIKIDEHGKRADSIVKNMLLHSRQGGGEKQLISFDAMVEEAMNLAYHGARAADPQFNIDMKSDLTCEGAQVMCLPQELQRVFLNLCSNAMYAAVKAETNAGHPCVTINTRVVDKQVVANIIDNGAGIPADIRTKIFQPFFTTKPTGEGTGLGLSMSFDIVQQHDGTLTLESEEGAGTTFSVSLPLWTQTEESSLT